MGKHSRGSPNCLACSPDGRLFASGAGELDGKNFRWLGGEIKVWNLADGREFCTLPGHIDGALSMAFSRDGRLLASGGQDKLVKISDLKLGRELLSLPGHSAWIQAIALSPNSKLLASGSSIQEPKMQRAIGGEIKLWDVASGRELRTLRAHADWCWALAFTPDSRLIASAGRRKDRRGEVRLWDTETGQEVRVFTDHPGLVQNLSFSSDGLRLAGASTDGTIRVWDVATGQELHTLRGFTKSAQRVLFSPDGLRLAALGDDIDPTEGRAGKAIQTVRLWDAAAGPEVRVLSGPAKPVTRLGFSPESDAVIARFADDPVKAWETQTGSERKEAPPGANPAAAVQRAVSPDGLLAAEIGSGGRVLIRSLPASSFRHTLPAVSATAAAVAFSPDSRWLAVAATDGSVQLWSRAGLQGEGPRRLAPRP
jgi:WD40 repeat protein